MSIRPSRATARKRHCAIGNRVRAPGPICNDHSMSKPNSGQSEAGAAARCRSQLSYQCADKQRSSDIRPASAHSQRAQGIAMLHVPSDSMRVPWGRRYSCTSRSISRWLAVVPTEGELMSALGGWPKMPSVCPSSYLNSAEGGVQFARLVRSSTRPISRDCLGRCGTPAPSRRQCSILRIRPHAR
jgi:hypothetical protein